MSEKIMNENELKVSEVLGISDKRDEELQTVTNNLLEKSNSIADFIIELENYTELNLREKLYVAAQMGRFHGFMEGKEIEKDKNKEDLSYIA